LTDKKVVLATVQQNGLALYYVSDELLTDKKVVYKLFLLASKPIL
jgi:hypothetical protein